VSTYQPAPTLFALEERCADISQRLFYYLMRLPTDEEIDRFLEIERRIGTEKGEAAVLAAWIRERQGGQRLPTNEVQAVGGCFDVRIERMNHRTRKRAS
jgi:hypothetical protein